jgi:hypothetical protein
MRPPHPWTEAELTTIVRMRSAEPPAPWDRIARAIGLSRWTVIEKGYTLGFRKRQAAPHREAVPVAPVVERDPEPLPPGHPLSWGALTAGTVLEGARYE